MAAFPADCPVGNSYFYDGCESVAFSSDYFTFSATPVSDGDFISVPVGSPGTITATALASIFTGAGNFVLSGRASIRRNLTTNFFSLINWGFTASGRTFDVDINIGGTSYTVSVNSSGDTTLPIVVGETAFLLFRIERISGTLHFYFNDVEIYSVADSSDLVPYYAIVGSEFAGDVQANSAVDYLRLYRPDAGLPSTCLGPLDYFDLTGVEILYPIVPIPENNKELHSTDSKDWKRVVKQASKIYSTLKLRVHNDSMAALLALIKNNKATEVVLTTPSIYPFGNNYTSSNAYIISYSKPIKEKFDYWRIDVTFLQVTGLS